jgi:hypothetical protein
MRERRLADGPELAIDRLDLRALKRHFDGNNARRHRRDLPRNVAEASGPPTRR